MKLKYVMTDKGPIIFSQSFNHSDFKQFNPKSAGLCEIAAQDNEVVVWAGGDSFTLGIKSNEQDESKIKVMIESY